MINCIVIDDQKDIVELICDFLEMNNVEVLAKGNNGKEAVELYEKYTPDIVFTDLAMPDYDGLYAVENIKDINPNAKIIVITANSNDYKIHLFELLKIPVISKPFNLTTLKQTITDVSVTDNVESGIFQIKYKFKSDYNYYVCRVNYEQYRNFKKLPIIEECVILNNDTNNNDKLQKNEIENALNLAQQNDTSQILKLSKIVNAGGIEY